MPSEKENKIIRILTKYPKGLTGTNISHEGQMSRTTAVKYLKELRKKGIVDYEEVGPAKLWHLAKEIPVENYAMLSVKLPISCITAIDDLVRKGIYKNYDEVITDAIKKLHKNVEN